MSNGGNRGEWCGDYIFGDEVMVGIFVGKSWHWREWWNGGQSWQWSMQVGSGG